MAIFVLGNLTNVVQENNIAFRKVDAIVTNIFTKLGARILRSLGIFSRTSDSSMCFGVYSASINEYQGIPGGKDGRCIRVTTLLPSCAECLEILEP
jgi:hypothetical protein